MREPAIVARGGFAQLRELRALLLEQGIEAELLRAPKRGRS